MAVQTNTFKGARYVPKFADPIEWSANTSYEAIESVQHNGFTYLSKQPVPVGVQIDNEEFWLLWADPNAQMEQLRQEVGQYAGNVEELSGVVGQWGDELEAEIEARENADAEINAIISKHVALNKPKILAHRGLSRISTWIYSIDNSLWSFMGAYANGFDGFECDVRKDVNGTLVMLHDADVSSVSDSSGDIATLDYTTVYYKTKKTNVRTNTRLTTLQETAEITKAFNGFMFVEVKDNTTAVEIARKLISYGLTYDNFGIFKDNDSDWFTDALQNTDEKAKIGYHTTDFTATPAEMASLKAICDQYEKPYDSIIVRCTHPEQVENIKFYGFLSSLDATTTQNEIDYQLVDYAIAERRWNGEQDALTNYKGIPYRIFREESNTETLKEYLTNIASMVGTGNYFFGKISGTNLNAWMVELNGINDYLPGTSNGAHIWGVKDAEFISGCIYIMRTNGIINFTYEFSTDKLNLSINPNYQKTSNITETTINGFITAAQNLTSNQEIFGYMTAAQVTAYVNKSNYNGAIVEATFTNVMCKVVLTPVNTALNEITIVRYTGTDYATKTVSTIAGA